MIAYQPLELPPGKYRLNVQLAPDSSKISIAAGENPTVILSALENTAHAVELEHREGGAITVHLITAGQGTAGIVKVGLELREEDGAARIFVRLFCRKIQRHLNVLQLGKWQNCAGK